MTIDIKLHAFPVREILLACALLCACQGKTETDTPVEPDPEPEIADYTVMVYACGGGTLDESTLQNLISSLNYGSTDKVKVTWQLNLSKKYQNTQMGGTVRFIVPEDPLDEYKMNSIESSIADIAAYVKPQKVSDTPSALYKPEVLSDYIDWAAEECPAKNYIFVFSGHGNYWVPAYEKTKSVLFDDNFDNLPMTIDEFVEGVKNSCVDRFAVIYNDDCFSCHMENYTAYADFADLAIGSATPAKGNGGRYNVLLQLLNGISNVKGRDLWSVLKTYCDAVAYSWKTDKVLDISLFDLTQLDEMNALLKDMVEVMVKNYPAKKDLYDNAVKDATVYYSEKGICIPQVDLYSLLCNVDGRTSDWDSDTDKSDISTWLKPYMEYCRKALYSVKARTSSTNGTTIQNGVYYSVGKEYEAAASQYEGTAFHEATGWGKVLSTFQQVLSAENNILNKE